MAIYHENWNKSISKELNVLVTDPGEEIDDEVAIECATRISKNSIWLICCVPGCSSENPDNSISEIEKRLILLQRLFPAFEISNNPSKTGWYMRLNTQLNSTFYIGPPSMLFSNNLLKEIFFPQTYIGTTLMVDNLIQIAPMWHIDPMIFDDIMIKNYIVMGDLKNPEQSINLTKAMPINDIYTNLRQEYSNQQRIIRMNSDNILSIPTSLARNVPMPYSLMVKLPNNLSEALLYKSFKICVSRVAANKPYANNISVVNHQTILNYCSDNHKEDIIYNNGINIIRADIIELIQNQTKKFLKNASNADKNDVDYIKRLEDIAKAVYLITKVEYKNNFEFNFSEEGLIDSKIAKQNWLNHISKYNCDLTPCYDLLAIIVKMKGYVPDVNECYESVLEF